LTSCSALPSLAKLWPSKDGVEVNADLQAGGSREIGVQEDNTVKVQTGDSSQNEYVADTVTQTYQEIQEYPAWLILAFAAAVGLAVPSPFSAWSAWRLRRRHDRLIDRLTASPSTSTTKPGESPSTDNSP
jgi:hypothetical protein